MKKFTTRIGSLMLILFLLCQSVSAAQMLVPVGRIVGLSLQDNTVTVTSFDHTLGDGAKTAGLQVGDQITSINGKPIHCAQDIRDVLNHCADTTVQLRLLRKGKAKTVTVNPQITAEGPRLGVYLKEGVTGVGTVTYYDPQTGNFGALGHGVNDTSGQLLSMEQGQVWQASVLSVRKGKIGEPGQLMGTLAGDSPIGALRKNTHQGVFGSVSENWSAEPLPIATSNQISEGPAVILSTIQDCAVQEYSAEILKIYPHPQSSGRNLLLRITDQRLLDTTGGIVQGMGVSYNKDNQWNP